MQLWQHDNGNFYVLYGPRLRERISTRTKDRGKAETFLSRFIAGSDSPIVEQPTIGAILDGYEADHGPEVESPDSLKYCVIPLKRFFGDLQPSHLTPKEIKKYAKQRGKADGTILRDIGVLRIALKWARAHKWIIEEFDIPNPVPVPKPRDRWITKEEARLLLAACRDPHLRTFVMLAIMTLARSGAIFALTWEGVNDRYIDYGEGHGNKHRAISPINDELRAALNAARELSCSDHVVEQHGRPIKSVRNGFFEACVRAGLNDVTPHILRHSGATWLSMQGVSMREIAKMMGDDEKTVERIYAKHSPEYLRPAAAALQLRA
jgi:integrase